MRAVYSACTKRIPRKAICGASQPSLARRKRVTLMFWMSERCGFVCVIDMSVGCETRLIRDVQSRKPASISRTKACQKRRELPRRCYSSRTIQRCLPGGPLRGGGPRLAASTSAPRSNLLAMRKQTKCTPAQRASKYLKRVAALTGAKQIRDDSYWLRAGRKNFLVDHKFIRLISHHGKSTCFSVAADPD